MRQLSQVRFRILVCLAGVCLATATSSLVFAKNLQTPYEICRKRIGKAAEGYSTGSWCWRKAQAEQAAKARSGACSSHACIYRLSKAGGGTYRGSGFTMRFSFVPNASRATGALVGPHGERAQLETSCGAHCAGDGNGWWVSGAHKGATFTAVGGDNEPLGERFNPNYVIITLPR
jgi:hypothetical protein